MRLQKLLLTVLITPLISVAQVHTEQTYVVDRFGQPRDHNVDMEHLFLDIAIDPYQGMVAGVANYVFHPIQQQVDTLFLDGPGIAVNAVKVDGNSARFRVDSAGVTIFFSPSLPWGSTHELNIEYTAHPKKGIYFVGWNEDTKDIATDPDRIRNQVWTQGQGTDNRFWIPSFDDVNDKLLTSLRITFDKNYRVISNGNLTDERNNSDGKTKTWVYEMAHPHANYLIMLAIGDYAYRDYTSKNGIVSRQYYYPDLEDRVEPTYAYSAEMMDWISEETGLNFPWPTYANVPVQEFLYGAMENTTATIFTDALFQDAGGQNDRSYVAVNAHELAHQWFGDYVTEWGNRDHWLQESFATHYSKKFRQSVYGEDEFQWIRRGEMRAAIAADNRDTYPLAHSLAGSSRHYPKGSFVLDMMRYVLGNEQYRKVINDYLLAHPYENVRSEDLEIQCMKSLGINMWWFFDQWVYRSGYPVYQVNTTFTSDTTTITVVQKQDSTATQHLFRMPVVFQVHYKDGGFDQETRWVEDSTTVVQIPNILKREVAFVLFDPGTQIISQVEFEKSFDAYKMQAYNAPLMIDRYDAVVAMQKVAIDDKRDILIDLYDKQNYHAIREEIIAQLANDDHKKSIALLKRALKDTDINVRRAVVTNLKTLPKKMEKDIAPMLDDSDYTNVELALRFLCEQDKEHAEKYLEHCADKYGAAKNIRIAWLEYSYANGNIIAAPAELAKYASNLYEFRTRGNAIQAINRLNICDAAIAASLVEATQSFNRRLAGPTTRVLKGFYENKLYTSIIDKAIEDAIQAGGDKEKLEVLRKKD